MPLPPMTAIIWNTDKYFGTPLELQDSRLGSLATWVQHHNLTVVKVLFAKAVVLPFFMHLIIFSWTVQLELVSR